MRLRESLDPNRGNETTLRRDSQSAGRLAGGIRPCVCRLRCSLSDRADRADDKLVVGRPVAERLEDRLRAPEWSEIDSLKRIEAVGRSSSASPSKLPDRTPRLCAST